MELNEFENEMKQDANSVNPNNLEFETDVKPEETGNVAGNAGTAEISTPPATAAALNLGDFGNMMVGAYCKLSDVVYTRIKKAAPPEWDADTKKLLNDAIKPVLSQYNVPVTPLTGLLATVATVEFVRYTSLTHKKKRG